MSIWDKLSGLLSGDFDPSLSPEQNRRARKRGMTDASLRIIMNAGRGGQSTLASIAGGALAGRESAEEQRGAYAAGNEKTRLQTERMQRLQQAIGNGEMDRDTVQKAFLESIKMGDMESARSLSEVLKTMQEKTPPIDSGSYMAEVEMEGPQGLGVYTYDKRDPVKTLQFLGKGKPKEISPVQQLMQQNREFQQENVLRDEYNKQISVVQNSYFSANKALKAVPKALQGDAAAKVAVLYGFIKVMDPNAVREGEMHLVRAAAPLIARAQNWLSDVAKGESPAIPEPVVKQMAGIMDELQESNVDYWKEQYNQYSGNAARWNVNPAAFLKPPTYERSQAGGASAPKPGVEASFRGLTPRKKK
jgi:hypothetical protein